MILIQGWVRLAPGEIERLAPAVVTMMRTTRAEEKGCLDYAFALDLAEPDLLRLSERWTDQAALDKHFATPHMAAFNKAMADAKILAGSIKAYTAEETRTLMGD